MPDAILLALTPEAADALRAGVAGTDRADRIAIRRVDPPLAAAIELAREEVGRIPLGVAARTPPEALEAIELGADEAIAMTSFDVTEVLELLDRTRARGLLRAQSERTRVDVAHAEKLTALGTLVAGVAHEVNNPLAVIVLTLEVLPARVDAAAEAIEELQRAAEERRGLTADEVVRLAALAGAMGPREEIAEQIDQMRMAAGTIRDVVRDLRVFARPDGGEKPEIVRVPELLEQLLRLVGRELSATAIIERDYGTETPEVMVPRSRLTQVLTNVLVNASHAMREVQRDVHRLRVGVRTDDDAVAVSISDTGPGIPAHALERIFDPFYTTKRASLGTGLGLSISRNLMRRMGGDLLVESVFGEGATFVVLMPRASEAELRAERLRSRTIPGVGVGTRRPTVLLVEDDPRLLRAYAHVLGRHFDLLLAADAREAIDMLSSGSSADAVLADLGLSSLDGAHLHRWLVEHRSELAERIVFVAAEPELPRHRELLAAHPGSVLPKPASAAALISAIEEACRR